ncbi:MAG: hypothetical protein EAZ37_10690 [Burkholderiales bacterium]|nr:MAG: hypothetical protein EAZ37_10690 [Burkholderiales bacterium]
MKRIFLPSFVAAVLASAALQAMAVGRVADVNVVDRSTGQTLPVHFHRGEYWVAGQPGAKYSIQIRNSRGARVLAVTSVDGLNVLSGETADFSQSGYVFESGQRYGIEGWRKSDSEVAAFVFTASGDSYAERIGKPRDMGVIGVALFRERPPVALYSPPVIAAPAGEPRSESSAPRSAELSDKFRESAPAPTAAPAQAPSPIASAAPQADASSRKAAPSAERSAALPPMPAATPKLGTAHGERETSVVSRTQFVRNSAQPDEIIRIRYDSHANLVALGVIPSPRYQPAPNPFPGAVSYVPDPPAWR